MKISISIFPFVVFDLRVVRSHDLKAMGEGGSRLAEETPGLVVREFFLVYSN